ncbi:hypothetical protein DFH09DRAFT_1360172 [Mycena vulgaris]|nr:hypothetical protein DFH09DRAFT_1360172 [Mycena vulgaris]
MPPRFPSNARNGIDAGGGWTLVDASSSWVPYSPQPTVPTTAPHLLQPPRAPRVRTVQLPRPVARIPLAPFTPGAMTGQDLFPIDLGSDLDLELLSRAMPNYRIPSGMTIHILPTPEISLIRAPLSLRVYHSELSPEVQQSVFEYFLSCSGPDGRRLWRDFLDGHHHPLGPTGAALLQGHFHLWGFSQDYLSRWVVDVDVQRLPLVRDVFTTSSLSYASRPVINVPVI